MFVQNVELFCKKKGVTRTEACRESGAGERLIENTKRGSVPSVAKVQLLAQYLGVTVSELLGETAPQETAVLHDSAVVVHSTDVKRLTIGEVEMIMAYRRASDYDRGRVDMVLGEYKKGAASDVG